MAYSDLQILSPRIEVNFMRQKKPFSLLEIIAQSTKITIGPSKEEHLILETALENRTEDPSNIYSLRYQGQFLYQPLLNGNNCHLSLNIFHQNELLLNIPIDNIFDDNRARRLLSILRGVPRPKSPYFEISRPKKFTQKDLEETKERLRLLFQNQ